MSVNTIKFLRKLFNGEVKFWPLFILFAVIITPISLAFPLYFVEDEGHKHIFYDTCSLFLVVIQFYLLIKSNKTTLHIISALAFMLIVGKLLLSSNHLIIDLHFWILFL